MAWMENTPDTPFRDEPTIKEGQEGFNGPRIPIPSGSATQLFISLPLPSALPRMKRLDKAALDVSFFQRFCASRAQRHGVRSGERDAQTAP